MSDEINNTTESSIWDEVDETPKAEAEVAEQEAPAPETPADAEVSDAEPEAPAPETEAEATVETEAPEEAEEETIPDEDINIEEDIPKEDKPVKAEEKDDKKKKNFFALVINDIKNFKTLDKKLKIMYFVFVVAAVIFAISAGYLISYQVRIAKERKAWQELVDSKIVVIDADSIGLDAMVDNMALAAQEKEEEEEEKVILPEYLPFYEQNNDMVGWIRLDGTVIDYPVMHTPDYVDEDGIIGQKYIHRDFNGEESTSGAIFIDFRCTMDPRSDNLILYGHHMRNGTMFKAIMNYEKKEFYEEHKIIEFDTLYEKGEYEVFSAFRDRIYNSTDTNYKFYYFIDSETKEDFDYNIENLCSKSLYDTGIVPEYGDDIIMLVTCAYHTNEGRFVVCARKIKDEETE
ncbi:MAG: class B sortase [Lachnospiraceae bacterium]|nr:class B sortase [Lachnospiraceae bacterium]